MSGAGPGHGLDIEAALSEALALRQSDRHEEAARVLASVLRQSPRHPAALKFLGLTYLESGNAAGAAGLIEQGLQAATDDAESRSNLGNALQKLNRHAEAVDQYREALRIDPALAEASNNLGLALRALKRDDEAVACFQDAIRVRPGLADAHYNLGDALQTLNRLDEAVRAYQEALRSRPDFARAHNNLGIALAALGRHGDARVHYEEACRIDPDFAPGQYNMAVLLHTLNRPAEANPYFERTVQLLPDSHDAKFALSVSLLSLGVSERAWRMYEHRRHCRSEGHVPDLGVPQWLGDEDPRGRRILLQWEQGYGDIIQMLRYVPLLQRMGAQCRLQLKRPLESLVRRSFPSIPIVAPKQPAGDVDASTPYASLPLAMRTLAESDIPRQVPYLRANAEAAERWRQTFGTRAPLTIGLVWRGNPKPPGRSIPVELLRPVLEQPAMSFIALQKDLTGNESAFLAGFSNVLSIDTQIDTFDDTAGAIEALDLVVTIDTSTAHLAGALGKPTWVLLRSGADWRWLTERTDSPWYPSVRLFRQSAPGDWGGVLRAVVQALAEHPLRGR